MSQRAENSVRGSNVCLGGMVEVSNPVFKVVNPIGEDSKTGHATTNGINDTIMEDKSKKRKISKEETTAMSGSNGATKPNLAEEAGQKLPPWQP